MTRWLETDSLSNQNISSALAIGAYTADADRLILCDVSVDAVAGGGDYVMYITRQINGAGSAYVILPKTTMTAAAGETAISGQSGHITVRSGDVLTVYVDGLAGDTATPDTTVRWFEMAALRPTAADRTVDVSETGEIGLDFDNVKAATASTTLTNITVPVVTTLTGHTAQTGDAYARIGSAGAGLTALGDTRLANLDAAVSTRSTYAGGDTSGVTTLLARIIGTLAAGTHNPQTGDAFARLGAPAGASVSADIADLPTVTEFNARTLVAANYFDPAADVVAHVTLVDTTTTLTNMPSAAPSAADIKTAMEADGGKLDHLWEMTEDDGGVRRLTTNALELAPSGGSAPSAATVADAVWDEALAGHVIVGSAGAGLAAAGSAGDPWSTTLPGAYTGNQAGAILDSIRDVTDAIDVSAVTVTASNDAGVLTVIQSVTFGATVSGLTISATWAKLYWTLKESIYDDDDQAIIQLVESNPGAGTDGLLYLDGAAIVVPITVADGTLTVNQAAGTVVIAVTDNATALLSAASELVWDIKTKDAAGATVQNTTGTASIVRAVTQTI